MDQGVTENSFRRSLLSAASSLIDLLAQAAKHCTVHAAAPGDAAVVHGAGYFLQFGGEDAAVDFFRGGEGLADGAELAAGGLVEEEALDGAGVAGEAGLDGGESAEDEFVGVRHGCEVRGVNSHVSIND